MSDSIWKFVYPYDGKERTNQEKQQEEEIRQKQSLELMYQYQQYYGMVEQNKYVLRESVLSCQYGTKYEYIVLNSNSKLETVFTLEQGIDTFPFYCVSIGEYKNINLDEKLWKKVTTPFFNETQNAIPSKNLHEIFGELL